MEGGDSFEIKLTEEGSTESSVSIGITVDLTFTEVGETIEIPVGNIIYDGPETQVKVVVKIRKLLSHSKDCLLLILVPMEMILLKDYKMYVFWLLMGLSI